MDTIPYGYCRCGCGQRTKLAPVTRNRIGVVKGQPQRFVVGHHVSTPRYTVEDRGHDTSCYILQRHCSSDGYAWYGRGSVARRMYEDQHGPLPPGYEIDHLCKQRACIRLSHLEAVAHTENIRRQSNTKLNVETAVEIRRLYAKGGLSYDKLAVMFGVSKPTIAKIIKGRTWK